MKLGILVVYLVADDNGWVLEKHLRHLASTEKFMDFRVYAAVNRLSDTFRSMLASYDFVQVVPLPLVEKRESGEHAAYLDMLATHAVAEGCNYICTFDVDSWPIRTDWVQRTYTILQENRAVAAAVLRRENGDTVLPHPSFCFLEARLFADPDCRYSMPDQATGTAIQQFLMAHRQHGDTGAALGYFLESRGLPWVKLLRSNKKDYHYLMAGIYQDIVFHVGASSRDRIVFRNDYGSRAADISFLSEVPVLWRIKPPLLKFLEMTYEVPVSRRNRRIYNQIAESLVHREDDFYQELRGEPREPSAAPNQPEARSKQPASHAAP